tara:strand:- start:561 stop:755 length:195 start_codon:yes stop_codon:yes gene_type:complete
MDTVNALNLCNDVINFYDSKEKKISKKIFFFKKILTKDNFSRKECLLLPFETLRKGLGFDNGEN